MLQKILSAMDIVRTIVYNTFYYSFRCGQFIIFGLKLLVDLFVILLKGVNLLLTALSESFAVFSEDISYAIQLIAEFVALIIQELQKISNIIFYIANAVVNTFIIIHTVLNDAIQSLLNLITLSAVHIKRLLVLFGSGMWFTVTLLPICIYNLGVLLVTFMTQIFQATGAFILEVVKNFKLSVRDIYEFIIDVPVESIIGLIVTVSLVYIFTQFYVTIFTCLSQQFFQLILKSKRLLNRVRRLSSLNFNHTPTRRFPQVRRSLSSPIPQNKNNLNISNNDDRCCVICQERFKCILLLPCRHVCLCTECNTRLQLYDNSCPICRHDIDDTMRIFV